MKLVVAISGEARCTRGRLIVFPACGSWLYKCEGRGCISVRRVTLQALGTWLYQRAARDSASVRDVAVSVYGAWMCMLGDGFCQHALAVCVDLRAARY